MGGLWIAAVLWPLLAPATLARQSPVGGAQRQAAITSRTLETVDEGALAAAVRTQGRATLVHLWASWCRPCVAELSTLKSWLRGAERRVAVVTVSLDQDARAGTAARLIDRAPGRALRASVADAFTVVHTLDPAWDGALPSTFLVDGEGRVLAAQRGFTDLQELASAIDRVPQPAHPTPRGHR
jgi:peroxiredoxin